MTVVPPSGASVVDLSGKSVIPGLVMMHEHLYYTTGPGVYGQLGASFSRLYLVGDDLGHPPGRHGLQERRGLRS